MWCWSSFSPSSAPVRRSSARRRDPTTKRPPSLAAFCRSALCSGFHHHRRRTGMGRGDDALEERGQQQHYGEADHDIPQRQAGGVGEGCVLAGAGSKALAELAKEQLADNGDTEGAADLLERLQRARARPGIAWWHIGQHQLENRREARTKADTGNQ